MQTNAVTLCIERFIGIHYQFTAGCYTERTIRYYILLDKGGGNFFFFFFLFLIPATPATRWGSLISRGYSSLNDQTEKGKRDSPIIIVAFDVVVKIYKGGNESIARVLTTPQGLFWGLRHLPRCLSRSIDDRYIVRLFFFFFLPPSGSVWCWSVPMILLCRWDIEIMLDELN